MTMIGQTLDGRYKIIELLGQGGFGQTYIAENTRIPGHPRCVVKHLKPSSNDPNLFVTVKRLFDSEAEMLSRLGNHDRIPRIIDFFDENQEFYLVQELIEGHPLSKELTLGKRLSESYVIALLKDLLPVLEFIHQQNVIHRDIKPDNIIRRKQDGKLVLIDFGAVKELQGLNTAVAGSTVAIGTPGYMSTEQGRGKPRPSSDIYALGIICIQALTGRSPLELTEDPDTGEVLWQGFATVSPGLAAIINQMVRYHFKDRYQSATEVLQALQQLENPLPPTQPISAHPPPVNPQGYTPTIPVSPPPLNHQGYHQAIPVNPPPVNPQGHQQTIPVPINPLPTRRKSPLIAVLGILGVGAIAAAAYFILPKIFTGGGGNNLNENPNNSDFQQQLLTENCRIISPSQNKTKARLRENPERNSDDLKSLTKGDKVVFISEQDAFIQVKTEDNTTGWIFRSEIQSCNSSVVSDRSPEVIPSTTESPSPEPTPSPETTTSLTKKEAVDVVSNWLNSKPQVFGQSYDVSPINEYTTGSYYQDNLDSLEKQKRTGEYYEFGTPVIEDVGEFSVSGDRATIVLTITEQTILYRDGKEPLIRRPSSTRRWDLSYVDGKWKIANNPKV
ncbi:protein kinase domain-containing protein [Merismopedia glauca]|uniref:non-specific serine/threonine protein kinase n=1 Tax=Merismopedia glauca CCAP 1448/3 TaxID=1296344 RepID=A0A2T1CAI7_9CYAN|nr:IMS domain-containing protein [Merismopedia glauca]PSB05285.1 serine/threonine protein kinase [Merismopedia glauca CCAP 1448/3]